ncbi:TolC family protein [Variovorax terrae]|uniref:TolC family protein n=1 Tax=Variovorax terrae TaxID=2923278 RepID=A0A9X1VS64_9BURK|nr:TolC family protein [Variovorax terrae]MCJ0762343.1 TolC family protein [Variovorax terrae]
MRPLLRPGLLAAVLALAGCAAPSPDGYRGEIAALTAGKTAGVAAALPAPDADTGPLVAELLAQPLDAGAAVRIALLNNPGLRASFATLAISDAERVRAGRAPNPHFALGRFAEGDRLEIERVLSFNVLGLLTLPWRAEWQGRQTELAKLQAAQDVVRLAAETRKAWIRAVAAQQSAGYLRDVRDAAETGAELARRMARVGNWSRLQQAREQAFLADATAQLARAEQARVAARERLTRLLGLWGTQAQYALPERLPDLPAAVVEPTEVEAQALRQRLDVKSAVDESRYVAQSLGYVRATGVINALDLSYTRNTTFDNARGDKEAKRGWEVELPLPLFDWGQAGNARAQGLYLQSVARVQAVAVQARSEAREAYLGWRTAYDLARHYRDEIVPLRRFINDEMVLRYNGMLASVWALLADTRQNVLAVNSALEAQRDFWLADTDLQTTLSGTSPGALPALASSAAAGGEPQGH